MAKERVKEERKTNQLDNKVVTKGFGKGRVELQYRSTKNSMLHNQKKSARKE